MITFLFKIAFITIISCFSPLKEGASSSTPNINKNFFSREAVPSFRSSVIESTNSYWEYDNVTDWYFEISSSDIANGNYASFTSTDFSSTYRITYEYLYNGSWSSGSAELVSYSYSGNVLHVQTAVNQRIVLEFEDGNLYLENDILHQVLYYVDALRLHYYNADPYNNFLYDLINYSQKFSEPYVFTTTQLNNYRFIELADFISNNSDYFDTYSRGKLGVADYSSSILFSKTPTEWGELDEDTIVFHLSGDFKGLFQNVNGFTNWNQSLNIYLPYGNIRDSFIQLVSQATTDTDPNVIVEYFDFNYDFNYNAPYSNTINQMFISDGTFTTSNSSAVVIKNIDLPYFISNGGLYNRIQLYYFNGVGTRYNSASNTYRVLDSGGFGYFNTMFFVNTDINYTKLVYTRLFSQYTDNDGNLQTYLSVGGTWQNTSYQHLSFIQNLSSDQKDGIAQFNNGTYDNGISNNYNFFGSSFHLIDMAFKGLASLLNVQVLPNVSLGVLIITPFIIGILLFVVALFKR